MKQFIFAAVLFSILSASSAKAGGSGGGGVLPDMSFTSPHFAVFAKQNPIDAIDIAVAKYDRGQWLLEYKAMIRDESEVDSDLRKAVIQSLNRGDWVPTANSFGPRDEENHE